MTRLEELRYNYCVDPSRFDKRLLIELIELLLKDNDKQRDLILELDQDNNNNNNDQDNREPQYDKEDLD